MRRATCACISACSVLVAAFFLLASPTTTAVAAPVFGKLFTLPQPDGMPVQVRIWGDEFYGITETEDGYSIVRDPRTLFFCYARLSEDGNELLSTGIPIGQPLPADASLVPHLRINSEAAQAKTLQARTAHEEKAAPVTKGRRARLSPTTGQVQGVCLIVDFSDVRGTIPPANVSDFCNKVGYTGYGNNGSVRDYYYDVSNGHLTYTNYVPSAYYRAAHPRSYYTDPSVPYGIRAEQLLTETLTYLENQGFNFAQFDRDQDGYIDALNCFYAGTCPNQWSEGLWPHSGWVAFEADGVRTGPYQLSDMGSNLTLGTFCHENGHMLCDWPDLYDYGYESTGVGVFCLMSAGSLLETNPAQPCAYMKYIAGWSNTTVLTTPRTGLSLPTGNNVFYKFEHPYNPAEYYLVENREATGRDALLYYFDTGMAIWHIDTNGSNDWEYMLPEWHYLVTLVQADGYWDLEHGRNYGDDTDLWGRPTYPQCTPFTLVNTDWWSGKASGLSIRNISISAATMTFDFSYTPDCDNNGTPDSEDISSGTSKDSNQNGIPDKCETDCKPNGVPDAYEVLLNPDLDCQRDGIPDDCQIGAWSDPSLSVAQNACADAQPVAPGIVYTGSTIAATNDGESSCGYSDASPDVWYLYVPAYAGLTTVSFCGGFYQYPAVLSVHAGCPGTAANQVACNDKPCWYESRASFWAEPGYKYLIRVTGWNGDSGPFMMSLTGPEVAPLSTDCNGNQVLDICEQLLPVIVEQPADQNAPPGTTVSFSVAAISNYTLSYRWWKNGMIIPGATGSTYTIYGVAAQDAGSYMVEVRSICGAVYSDAASLTVFRPLTVSVLGEGSVIIDPPGGLYDLGDVVSLLPQPAAGWRFSYWGGRVHGTSIPVYVTIIEDTNVTAVFERVQRTLSANVQGQGSIRPTPAAASYADGAQVLLEALAAEGWRFVNWEGDASGSASPITVVMDRDRTVGAVFQQDSPVAPTPQDQTATQSTGALCGLGASASSGLILLLAIPLRRRRRKR